MKHVLVLLLFLAHSILSLHPKPVTYIWDIDKMDSLRLRPASQEYKKIIRKADAVIRQLPVAVTDKTFCLSGDEHNYESLSIYWWPNPQSPGGPYIARDGEFNPEYKQYDYPRLLTLKDNLTACSRAFFLTRDEQYYDFFCKQIDRWFINPGTRMNPDFEYSQIIPGRNNGMGNPQGMVDAYNFTEVIDAVVLVNSIAPLGRARMKALKRWMYAFATWMEESENGKTASRYINNQAIAYEVTLFRIYTFTSRKSRALKHASACLSHIKSQIEDDGRQPQEMRRATPLTYVNFNLRHMEYFLSICPDEMIDREASEKVAKARRFAEAMKSEK